MLENLDVVIMKRVQVICPACGQQVEAVATDRRVKGYCAVAKQPVDFLIETHTDETKAEISVGLTPGRDSRGRFVKGNVPQNTRNPQSSQSEPQQAPFIYTGVAILAKSVDKNYPFVL